MVAPPGDTVCASNIYQASHARPRPDQVWVWGCVDVDDPTRFFFCVLDAAEDALEGKPRGKEEIKACLLLCGFGDPSVLLTTDSWKGTIVAVREYRALRTSKI